MAERVVPNYIRDFAREHNVELAEVPVADSSSGVNLIDVSQWAHNHGDTDLAASALTEQFRWNSGGAKAASTATAPPQSVWFDPARPLCDEPLVDLARAEAAAAGRPGPNGVPPTLFIAGDTPSFTASGIPPRSLLEVPWHARHAMAAAPTAADAYAIQTEYTGPAAAADAAYAFSRADGNTEYADRVSQWVLASMSDADLLGSLLPGAAEERSRRQAAATEAFNASLPAW